MKRFVLTIFLCSICFLASKCLAQEQEKISMINPWLDCGKDFDCAIQKSEIKFPKNDFALRAMNGMIEVLYPIDSTRTLIIRKSYNEGNNGDISGDYNKYPINGDLIINDTYKLQIRGDAKLINVANFKSGIAYYSFICKQGITKEELKKYFDILLVLENIKSAS